MIERAKKIHASALTVDSHVDTPMWLTREGFDFTENHSNDKRPSKLDLPRMVEGGLDGVFFAVFVGQDERTPEGNANALAQANRIIDSIYSMVGKHQDKLGIVTTPAEFRALDKKVAV